jgi:hypothetical protein
MTDHDGQPVSLGDVRHVAVGEYVLDDPHAEYRHFAESMAYFRQDQRMAISEPAVSGEPATDE